MAHRLTCDCRSCAMYAALYGLGMLLTDCDEDRFLDIIAEQVDRDRSRQLAT